MRISDWSSDVCSSDLTQLLGTRLAHIARRPEITSVTRPAAESASERPARYSPEYHRQRIYVDAATLAEMANDEVMLSTGTATSLVVLNGVGRRGMAARFAGFLSVNGYSSTRLGDTLPTRETELLYPRSEEHTSELQSLMRISYA